MFNQNYNKKNTKLNIEQMLDKAIISRGFSTNLKTNAPKEELGERFLRKYCLLLHVDVYTRIELHEKNKPDATYWAVKPEEILNREKEQLTQKQKDLLVFLGKTESRHYNIDIDWGMLFGLIRDSEIAIFLNKKNPRNRVRFKEQPQKIAAQLLVKENNEHLSGEAAKQKEIIFKLKGDLFEKNNVKLFLSTDSLVVLNDLWLEIFPIPKILLTIVSRILADVRSYAYGYQQDRYGLAYKWETALTGSEVIKINEVILAAEKFFAFKNKTHAKFEINKFKKAGPAILLDYNNAENSLQVKALMDYGFVKIDVANAVYKSMRTGRANFQKRYSTSEEEYYLEIAGDKINYADIDDKAEIALFKKFSEDETLGFSKTAVCSKKGVKQIANFHENYWPKIKELGLPIECARDEFDFVEEDFKADFKVDFNDANDWFEFDVNCYCGENKITLEDLRRFVENKEQFIKMADGRMMKITNRKELEKFVAMLESFYQKEGQKFEAKIFHAPELEDIISGSQYYEAKISNSFKKFMDEAQSGSPVESVEIPAKISKPLRDYQKEGIDWFYFLRKYHFGGILADDMGLGKTLQALSLVEMNKIAGKPSLVICPKTLLFNWEDEATKFFPSMKTLLVDGLPIERQQKLQGADKFDLVITSYPSIKKDQEHYDKLKFNYCFIDEAQYIKNHKTQNASSVKKIHADYRLALTGTPLENSVAEIWSFFDFLMPGFLGTHKAFGERFEKPIMKQSDSEALEALRKKISCFMLRRTKEKVLRELPPKIEQVSHCQLGSDQNILYQEILANVKSNIFETVQEKGFAKSQIHILAGLTKLRQVCNHPVLLLKDSDHEKYSSAKLELFLELVDEIAAGGKKVLVFSQFTQMLDILAKELEKKDIKHHYLSGKTNNRKELVTDFNENEKIPVFLISLKAGGTGLNLVSADNVIIFDPWWNPSVENQAIDRAHRIGQKKSVNVYRLIVKGTIEEKIVQLQEKKKFLFDNMVGESNDLFQKLTWSDVKELFE
ncbi:MAG: DEAD/DEAH box helicase [Candidatus Moranbacteria bacterium]|nr:DEAD/DEAH box helicase [Candidatus Moranbacteria bacterium]